MSFFTPVRETDPQQAMSSTSSPVAFLTSPFFPSRKRRAPSPPSSPQQPIFPHQSGSTSSHVDHHGKRRRPNLANGFSGLTINARSVDRASSPLPSYEDSQATHHEVDDDEAISRSRLDLGDVRVEELPNFPRFPRRGDSTSSSSTTPADEDYDSDSTYRLPSRSHRYAGVAQQADQVVQPNRESSGSTNLDVEDVTDQTPVRGRKRRDDFEDDLDAGWKQSRWDMDLDADMDMSDSELPEIPRMERQRRRTEWHEPEKDRKLLESINANAQASSSQPSAPLHHPAPRRLTARHPASPNPDLEASRYPHHSSPTS